jgi:hypothetical protein
LVEGAVNASEMPERDLSVQLSGWMLMEAAHTLSDDDAPEPEAASAPEHQSVREEEAE